ncbi:hypothetical protein SRHO_G00276050 [Serrasalmus rhombeus]
MTASCKYEPRPLVDSSSAGGERRRSSSSSGPSGPTGTCCTYTAATRTSDGLFKRLLECFPEDRGDLSKSTLLEGLVRIKEAKDIEVKLNEVEKLLKNTINMPWKFSRSEVVLTFFERSPLDQVLRNDNVHKIQPCFQSPVKISEIMRSNGFCLANTETIVFDENVPQDKERPSSTDSAEHS